jgi:translation initiation factor 3 subunit B
LSWSPQGSFIIFVGHLALNGTYEFYNANDMESMSTEEHLNSHTLEWDPTGRFVATTVSKTSIETGYNIYSFQGKLIRHVLREKFHELKWRPRPPSLLPEERINYIKKNIREFSKDLKREDNIKEEEERKKKRAQRQALRDAFEALIKQTEKDYEANAAHRKELGHDDEEDERDIEYKEKWVEEVLEVQEIIIQED